MTETDDERKGKGDVMSDRAFRREVMRLVAHVEAVRARMPEPVRRQIDAALKLKETP